jgi:hypothetical protein
MLKNKTKIVDLLKEKEKDCVDSGKHIELHAIKRVSNIVRNIKDEDLEEIVQFTIDNSKLLIDELDNEKTRTLHVQESLYITTLEELQVVLAEE